MEITAFDESKTESFFDRSHFYIAENVNVTLHPNLRVSPTG